MYLWKLCLFLSTFLLILTHFRCVEADCNVCSTTSTIACVSNTQFQLCVGGVPTGPVNSCPTGYICAPDAGICQPKTSLVTLPCNECNQCNANLTYACTSSRTFALCLGTPVISNITGTCADSLVCRANSSQICVSPLLGATCSLYDGFVTTTAAPSSTVDPTAICRIYQRSGRYPIGISLTTTCRQYFSCYLLGGLWYGAIYTCPGSTYFNSAYGLCTATVPSRCVSTVRSLQTFNFDLT